MHKYFWEYLNISEEPEDPIGLAQKWEAETYGDRDGDGKRYWINSLYLLGGDVENAVLYYDRYLQDHVDESLVTEPEFLVTALLCGIKTSNTIRFDRATGHLTRCLYVANPYVYDRLLNMESSKREFWHRANTNEQEYAFDMPEWLFRLWDNTSLSILSEYYLHEEYQSFMCTQDSLWHAATTEPAGSAKRKDLLERHQQYLATMIVLRSGDL